MMKQEGNKPITVKGAVILSTIETMETFGEIGKEVLAEHGVRQIDENKLYPYELRNHLHKALLDRFGENALIAFGFKNGETFQSSVVDDTQKNYVINLKKSESENSNENREALESIFHCLRDSVDKLIKINSQSVDINYGASLDVVGVNKFRYSVITPSMPYQLPFMVGTIKFHFAKLFEKFWEYNLTVDKNQCDSGYGYTKTVFDIKFKRKPSAFSQSEIVMNRKMEIRDQLIRSVLLDSNKQVSKVESLLSQLAKYTPPQIHQALVKGDHDTEITTRRKKLTIFFSDIKNFTSTSEGLQPEDLTKYLNEYFSEMTTIALDCGATIDKYIGDAMMVFFGDPESKGEKEDARACVEMSLKMQERIKQLQEKWRNDGFSNPFEVRIGINSGYCNVGNFGSTQRLTYTVIGGEVNIAQRLESNANANGILISYETFAHVQDMIEVEERDTIEMKGINRKIKVFSVIARKSDLQIPSTKEKKMFTKKQSSKIEELEKDVAFLKSNLQDLNRKMNIVLEKL